MTANVITYRSRSAVRDFGKVLGFGEEELGRLAAEMPHFEWKDEKDTMEKRFRDSGLNIGDPRIAKRLAWPIRHGTSKHAGLLIYSVFAHTAGPSRLPVGLTTATLLRRINGKPE